MKPDYEAGEVILVDKPYGWTSFNVVNFIKHKTKRITGNKKIKVGHAGTLDPLATGLVIVCTGKKTKDIDRIQATTKTYKGTIFLGATTASYDLETKVSPLVDVSNISNEGIHRCSKSFIGVQYQLPPQHSAKRIDGQRAYKSARKGIIKEMKPNEIEIFQFDITKIDLPQLEFEIQCSKGTYIRSIAYDFGKKLGCGGFLAALRRTESGEYSLSNAYRMEDLKIMLDKAQA